MKRSSLLALSIVILLVLCQSLGAKDAELNSSPTRVYFSPNGGATSAIVRALADAKNEILVQAYSFTSKKIAEALVDAHKRGVHIEIILDKSNRSKKYSAADFMSHMGLPTYIDAAHAIAHNKIMIIDRNVVITGSFNFTRAAETNNAENLMIIQSPALAKIYVDNWELHKRHSQIYTGR